MSDNVDRYEALMRLREIKGTYRAVIDTMVKEKPTTKALIEIRPYIDHLKERIRIAEIEYLTACL